MLWSCARRQVWFQRLCCNLGQHSSLRMFSPSRLAEHFRMRKDFRLGRCPAHLSTSVSVSAHGHMLYSKAMLVTTSTPCTHVGQHCVLREAYSLLFSRFEPAYSRHAHFSPSSSFSVSKGIAIVSGMQLNFKERELVTPPGKSGRVVSALGIAPLFA